MAQVGCRYSAHSLRRRQTDPGMWAPAKAHPHPPGWIQKVHPPTIGSVFYNIRVLESRIRGPTFWILSGVWASVGLRVEQSAQGPVFAFAAYACPEGPKVMQRKISTRNHR